MIRRYGIDTSILVRLLTRDPISAYEYCVATLTDIVENQAGEVSASNQVIGEAYIAVQLHYGSSKSEARSALLDALRSGFVRPLNGPQVMDMLSIDSGAGLVDRLIADGYSQVACETLTLDRRMANLPGARTL